MIELISIFSMSLDHIGKLFYPQIIFLQIIGRLSFILYAFFISLGYQKTHNSTNYFYRVLIIAIMSQFFYGYLFGYYRLNVCFTLSFGILFLKIYDNKKINKVIKYFALILILISSLFLGFEYGIYGILTIFIFYFYRNKSQPIMVLVQTVNTIISVYVFSFPIEQLFSLASFLIIVFSSSKNQKLKWPKYINYLIYPLHLAILVGVTIFVRT